MEERRGPDNELEEFAATQLQKLFDAVNSLAENYADLGDTHHKTDVSNLVKAMNAIDAQQTSFLDKYLQAGILLTSSYFQSFRGFEKGIGRQASSLFGLKQKDFTDKFIKKINEHPNKSHFTRMLGLITKDFIIKEHREFLSLLESIETTNLPRKTQELLANFDGHFRAAHSANKIIDTGKYKGLSQDTEEKARPRGPGNG